MIPRFLSSSSGNLGDSPAMAAEMQSQEEVQEMQFRRQLAACVRSIQWSYAIFWSMSTRQAGLLEWSNGYYNGDIRTRKTTQPTECNADQLGLQRSEQLKELYESLSTGDSNEQTRRPTASLSPEDLTDAEWYYLVCMSFTFNMGQDLPGKVLEHNEPIWLSNAQFADNSSFCRSLLAKSASIQTVVCLPFMDGVLELGTSDLVLEDPGFLQYITTSFWEMQVPDFSEHSTSSPPAVGNEQDNMCTIQDHEVDDTIMFGNHGLIMENSSCVFPFSFHSNVPNKETEIILDNAAELHQSIYEEIMGTPEGSANVRENPFKIERHNELTNDCVSWSFTQSILSSPKGEIVRSNQQEENHAKFGALGIEADGSHYASTIYAILRSLKPQTSLPGFAFRNVSPDSSFKIWRGSNTKMFISRSSQKMLKKILMDKNWLNGGRVVKHQEEIVPRNKACKSEAEDANANHVLSERRRREKLNEKFLILRSLVPSISKVDKASILADTIEYLKELERRVEELESCREDGDPDIREKRKHPDITERTSDNYGNNELINCQKPSTNKRKVCEIEEEEGEHNAVFDINVTMIDKEVLVEMHCTWKIFLLLDIIEAMSNLRLDVHSVQSSTVNGALAITLRAKFMSTVIASPGMIKRALQRVVGRC